VKKSVPPGVLPVAAIDRASDTPLYRQLYEGYRDAIVERRLRAGQRLPSTRSLAAELRISRIPVLNAFDQLTAEGYFESRVGSGTFVARSLPEELSRAALRKADGNPMGRPGRRTISRLPGTFARVSAQPWFQGPGAFSVGQPPVDQFPAKTWSALVARHSRMADPSLLHYGAPMGLPALRESLAEYLRTSRGVRCEADQIMIVNGSQQAVDLAARVLLEAGDEVWIEEPGYFGAQKALRMAGARLVPVPVDAEGLNVDAGIARGPRARAVFVTPSHQCPLGVTMSAARRLQLLDWARREGAWIIEDDYDSEYRFGNLPVPALQGLDRDSRVLYIGTFTKMLFPALRLGYLVLPRDLVSPFTILRKGMDFFSPTFAQAVLADFIREGHFERHIRRTRLLCRERRTALLSSLERELGPRVRVLGDAAGMFLTAALPDGFDDQAVGFRAASFGVRALPLSECYAGRPRRRGLVLGYGGVGETEIATGVSLLRRAIEDVEKSGLARARQTGRRAAGDARP
jgi:GntR family transcriptional regulator/MocR family aminotransferase